MHQIVHVQHSVKLIHIISSTLGHLTASLYLGDNLSTCAHAPTHACAHMLTRAGMRERGEMEIPGRHGTMFRAPKYRKLSSPSA